MNIYNSKSRKQSEQNDLDYPLISSRSRQQPPLNKIGVVNLVNHQQEDRETRINLNTYKPYTQNQGKRSRRVSMEQTINKYQRDQEEQEHQRSHKNIRFSKKLSVFTEQESFISNYQNNFVVGFIIYLVFIAFISAQITTASLFIPMQIESSRFQIEKTLLTILLSQTLYYFIVRFFNSRAQKKFIKHSSVLFSLKTMVRDNRHRQSSSKRAYWIIMSLVVLLMLAESTYCCLLMDSTFFFNSSEDGYLIATIFWANTALPFIAENFYFSEIHMSQTRNLKLKIFPYIILGFMFQCLLQSWLLFALMGLKLLLIYLYTREGYDMFHLKQLIKLALLCLVIFFVVVKFAVMDSGSFFSLDMFTSICQMLGYVVLITTAMLITRLVALIFIKQQLLKHFYTDMHVQLAFICSTLLMYLSYTHLSMDALPEIHSFIAIIFLFIIGVLVYMEGKQRLEVCIDINQNSQHL